MTKRVAADHEAADHGRCPSGHLPDGPQSLVGEDPHTPVRRTMVGALRGTFPMARSA